MGLYHGVSLDKKSVMDLPRRPDMVFLYRRPLLDYWAEGNETLGHLVTHVLVHEIGHHFGLSDADMERIEGSRSSIEMSTLAPADALAAATLAGCNRECERGQADQPSLQDGTDGDSALEGLAYFSQATLRLGALRAALTAVGVPLGLLAGAAGRPHAGRIRGPRRRRRPDRAGRGARARRPQARLRQAADRASTTSSTTTAPPIRAS